MLIKTSHRKLKRQLQCMSICTTVALIVAIQYLRYTSQSDIEKQMVFRLGRLRNYNEIINKNRTSMDTYFQRLKDFLYKTNISMLAYEQSHVTPINLLEQINEEILYLQQIQQKQLLNIRQGEVIENGCQQSCCWSKKRIIKFYNGEISRLPTILDRLSQIDFKLLADLHYGNARIPDGINLPKLTYDILPCLQNNTVIFVDTISLKEFFRDFHKKIQVKYVLMTGDSDFSCPYYLIRTHGHLLDEILSGKTNIIHWFSMNCHLGSNEKWKKSKIFSCIPQGISQWRNQRYYMHLASGKDDSIYNKDLKSDDYWILISFNRNNGLYRRQLWDLFCSGRLKNLSKCFYDMNEIDQWRYYMHIGRSRFVLSPPGDGLDCYRTWETIYLGSIPIILDTSINSIFEKLPVVIVNKYEDINLEFLKDMYDKMTSQNYDYKRLYKGYWQNRINSFRNSTETVQIHYNSLKN